MLLTVGDVALLFLFGAAVFCNLPFSHVGRQFVRVFTATSFPHILKKKLLFSIVTVHIITILFIRTLKDFVLFSFFRTQKSYN